MATQYVILETGSLNNRSRVAVHTDIPAGTNAVGTTWQQALVDFQGTPVTSVVPDSIMPGGRQAELDAGSKYEWTLSAVYDANASNANKLLAVEAQITAEESAMLDDLQDKLRFWGQTGTL